jgi:hypothetical protein
LTEGRGHAERRRARRRPAPQYADEAAATLRQRREEKTGVSRWVARRAGEWSLDSPDWTFMERQKYRWNQLIDY